MARPKCLDAFCGGGGAGMGYQKAGFEVVGVDNKPQPRYPFEFVQADALEYIAGFGSQFDLIHTSPPCQKFSAMTNGRWQDRVASHPDLIEPTRELLKQIGKPYVIENVEGAPLKNPIMLCGSMFVGVRVIRHRLFETNPPLYFPPASCYHRLCYTVDKRKKHYKKLDPMTANVQVYGGGNFDVSAARDAMGIDWMTQKELTQAIPPAYTKWIGEQMMEMVFSRG